MSDLKTKLIKQAKHDEFKLAIASQADNVQNKQKQWISNPFLLNYTIRLVVLK